MTVMSDTCTQSGRRHVGATSLPYFKRILYRYRTPKCTSGKYKLCAIVAEPHRIYLQERAIKPSSTSTNHLLTMIIALDLDRRPDDNVRVVEDRRSRIKLPNMINERMRANSSASHTGSLFQLFLQYASNSFKAGWSGWNPEPNSF